MRTFQRIWLEGTLLVYTVSTCIEHMCRNKSGSMFVDLRAWLVMVAEAQVMYQCAHTHQHLPRKFQIEQAREFLGLVVYI